MPFQQVHDFIVAKEVAEKERKMVDAILEQIRTEDEAGAAARAKQRAETARVIAEFQAQREAAISIARAAEIEEDARILAYHQESAARDADVKRARAEDLEAREASYRALVAEQEAARAKQAEEDELQWLLVQEESERRRMEEDKARAEQLERGRREMMAANEEQRRMRERRAVEEREREQALIAQFLAKCAADEARINAAKAARAEARAVREGVEPCSIILPSTSLSCAVQRYMAEIVYQRDAKQQLFEAQKLAEAQELEAARAKDAFRAQVVEAARRQLLQEHAAVLVSWPNHASYLQPCSLTPRPSACAAGWRHPPRRHPLAGRPGPAQGL